MTADPIAAWIEHELHRLLSGLARCCGGFGLLREGAWWHRYVDNSCSPPRTLCRHCPGRCAAVTGAAAAGIELGDVILGTANAPLRSVGELSRALADGSGELALLIEREGMRTFVALPLDGPQVGPTDISRTAGPHMGPTHPLQ
jgi:hypothetical protein